MSSQAVDNTVWNQVQDLKCSKAQRCRIYKKRCGGIRHHIVLAESLCPVMFMFCVAWCPYRHHRHLSSYCFSPPIKASRPNFEKPIHNWNPHLPQCVVSRKWKPQQPKCWNNLKHHPLLTLLLPCISLLGCCHYIIGLTNVEAGPKRTRSYEFGRYALFGPYERTMHFSSISIQ